MHNNLLRRAIALSLFALALLLNFVTASWQENAAKQYAEKTLGTRAATLAEQLANLLALPGFSLDIALARPVVFTAMKDQELYAVKIINKNGLLEGQRRSANGELEPWDGEITEKTVQALCPIWSNGRRVGAVEIYLRADPIRQHVDQVASLETQRLILHLFFCILCLGLYAWHSGDLRTLGIFLKDLITRHNEQRTIHLPPQDSLSQVVSQACAQQILDPAAAKTYFQQDPWALHIAGCLFYNTFVEAPRIMARLAMAKKYQALRHVTTLLLQSAPCIGAHNLEQSARNLKTALEAKDVPEAFIVACIRDLQELLSILHPAAPEKNQDSTQS